MPATIKATISRTELQSLYLKDLPNGGLFIKTDGFFGLDDAIQVELDVPELGTPMLLTGKVAWHRRPRAWSSTLPSGIGFEFHRDSFGARDFLRGYAQGNQQDRRRGGVRRMDILAAKLKIEDSWHTATTRNVGVGGIMLECERELTEGTNLQCIVYSDDAPQPVDCNVIIDRVEKDGGLWVAAGHFQRTTPAIRRTFSAPPPPANHIQKRAGARRPGNRSKTITPMANQTTPSPSPYRTTITPQSIPIKTDD